MILDRLFDRRMDTRQEGRSWEVVLQGMQSERESATDVNVTPESALRLTAVYAAASLLADTIGGLPLITYERQGTSRRRATEHYLYSILHDSPNEMMTAIEFRSAMQGYLVLRGNAIAQVEYDESGRVTELWPLRWENVLEYKVEQQSGRILYHYLGPDNVFQWISSDVIWHLRGWGSDGIVGYSPIGLARRAVGLGLAAEEFGARFFGNDARPGVILEHPAKLGKEAHERLRDSWEDSHKGLSKSHRVAILEEGLKVHEVGIPPEDAQFLETRKFQVSEIARMFRVPPHMIGDLDRATFTNIEHQGIEFVTYSLQSWITRWEQSIKKNLLLPGERDRYYVEHLVDSLLRGDTTSRYQAYQSGIQAGWFTRADAREKENLEPIEGLEQPLVPLNMMVMGEEPVDSEEPEVDSAKGDTEMRGDGDKEREVRGLKAAKGRRRLEQAYRPVYLDTILRVLRRERNDVGKAAKRILELENGTEVDFISWMDQFYREHPDFVIKQVKPVGRSYGQMIADSVGDEVGREVDAMSVDKFIESYVGGYGARHSGISQARLKERLTAARRGGENMLEAIEDELDRWIEIRSNQIAAEESVRFGNAMAKMAYGVLGVSMLRSVAIGESNCPYCEAMDGKVVGIKQNFISAGESFQPEGTDKPLTSTTDLGHPPYHEGCDCIVVGA